MADCYDGQLSATRLIDLTVRRGIDCKFGLFSGSCVDTVTISRTAGGLGADCTTPTTSTFRSRCCWKLAVALGSSRYVGTSMAVVGPDARGVNRNIPAMPGSRFSGSLVTSADAGIHARTQPTVVTSSVRFRAVIAPCGAWASPMRPTVEIATAAHTPAMSFISFLRRWFLQDPIQWNNRRPRSLTQGLCALG